MTTDRWKCSDKNIKRVLQDLEAEGWTVVQTRKHLKVYSPDERMRFTAPVSPSDRRAFPNARADLCRAKKMYENVSIS